MPEQDRGIGSEGLEQGGPDLGNDYTRTTGSRTESGARDAIIVPREDQQTRGNDETLNMDSESSRNLTSEYDSGYSDELEDEDEDEDEEMMEDDVLQGLDDDDDVDDDNDEENDII